MHQQPGALDVGEELVAKPSPRRRPFDQPRDVGDHKLPIVVPEGPECRLKRGERVVGDLGARASQPSQQ